MSSVATGSIHGSPPYAGAGTSSDGTMTSGRDNGIRQQGGSMHPAPSLLEAPPAESSRSDYALPRQHALQMLSTGPQSSGLGLGNQALPGQYAPEHVSGHEVVRRSPSGSPPIRKDTQLSTSTTATNATSNAATATSPTSTASSPTAIPGQTLFSINNADTSQGRRGNRRRTGPLLPEQREKAAIIRKMGACDDCRRRRVACQPEHHNMTWDLAYERFGRDTGSTRQEAPPLSPIRGFRATNVGRKRSIQELEDDSSGQGLSRRSPPKTRKPLPSAPRLEKTAQAVLSMSPETVVKASKPSLQTASPGPVDSPSPDSAPLRMLMKSSTSPNPTIAAGFPTCRNFCTPELQRYMAVHVLFLYWEDEGLDEVKRAIEDLRKVFQEQYRYNCHVDLIPSFPDPFASWTWLSNKVDVFNQHANKPNTLKIVYYNGRSYIDRHREMVLANSISTDRRCEIKWKDVQAKLEPTVADTLILMDCPYMGPRASRQNSVITVMASCDFNEYGDHPVPRCFFTRRVAETLGKYARQTFRGPSYTTGLAADIMNDYLCHIPDARTDQEILTTFPSPLHQVLSGDTDLPIMLAPVPRPDLPATVLTGEGRQSVNVRIDFNADGKIRIDDVLRWMRRAPMHVLNVRMEAVDT